MRDLGAGISPIVTWVGDKLLAPALVAVLFAGTTTIIIERYRGRRDAVSKMSDSLRDDLRAIQELAIAYWSRGRVKDDAAVEARITAAQNDILQTLRLVHEALELRPVTSSLDEVISELLDAVTGGDFQTAGRKADLARVRRVAGVVGELRSEISRARIRQLSLFPAFNGSR